jgi:hypothetical protein
VDGHPLFTDHDLDQLTVVARVSRAILSSLCSRTRLPLQAEN